MNLIMDSHRHSLALVLLLLSCLISACLAFSGRTTTSLSSSSAAVETSQQTTKSNNNNPLIDFDYENNDELPWYPDGYKTWEWKGEKINYIELGDESKPKLLLIHGFGASSYHFRYNIPELAREYHVFAFCKVGFGLSTKPLLEYSVDLWKDQTSDFLKEVIGGKPTTLIGNSIGGFTAMYTAAYADDDVKDMVNGVVLLNAAGRFKDPTSVSTEEATTTNNNKNENDDETSSIIDSVVKFVTTTLQRLIISGSFIVTKQPARIEQILKQVYPIDDSNVDDKLVESIRYPSDDPNASEVFYRVIRRNANGNSGAYVDDVMNKLLSSRRQPIPMLLCWGEHDPWIRPEAADKIQNLYPKAIRASIDAGHCPHDEAPKAVNAAISNFMERSIIGTSASTGTTAGSKA